jgi:hypothetical protein
LTPPERTGFVSRLLLDREGHFRGFDRAWVVMTRLGALASLSFIPFSCCFWPIFLGLALALQWISFTPWALGGPRRPAWLEVTKLVLAGLPAWIWAGVWTKHPPRELRDLPWDHGLIPLGLATGLSFAGCYLIFLIATRLRLLSRWRKEHAETDREAAASATERLEGEWVDLDVD